MPADDTLANLPTLVGVRSACEWILVAVLASSRIATASLSNSQDMVFDLHASEWIESYAATVGPRKTASRLLASFSNITIAFSSTSVTIVLQCCSK